jgi:hypothetical protein
LESPQGITKKGLPKRNWNHRKKGSPKRERQKEIGITAKAYSHLLQTVRWQTNKQKSPLANKQKNPLAGR